MAVDRSLIRLLLAVFTVALAVLWLFAAMAGFAVPPWAPPAGLLALAVGVLL